MKTSKYKIVLDTNVLLVSLSPESQYHWILEGIIDGTYEIYITNDILLEYQEIISTRYSKEVVQDLFGLFLTLSNVKKIDPHFKWNLITVDPDDNKFVDCYVSSGSQYLITNDKHFNILNSLEFPKIILLTVDDFKELVENERLKK